MGSSYQKDEKVEIFMELNRQYYVAGQEVHGYAYLDVKETRPYLCLQILVSGKEYVYWQRSNGKKEIIIYHNSHISYYNSFTLHNFQGTVPRGQYSFPFSFILPSMMCGSFKYSSCIYSRKCYIEYMCTARLTHSEMKKSQIYGMHLNIMESPREIKFISTTESVYSQCCGCWQCISCGCCASYGEITVTLNCSKNFLISGQNFVLSGIIDNSRGKKLIKKSRIILEQWIRMTSSGGPTQKILNHEYSLQNIDKQVSPGESYNLQFESVFPNVNTYTANGTITARYFIIHLNTKYGCCANTASATLKVIVQSTSPSLMINKNRPKPANWNPQQFPSVRCKQMRPLFQIPILNLPDQNQSILVNQINQHQNYQPNFGNYQQSQQLSLENNQNRGGGKQPQFNLESDRGMIKPLP